MPGKGGARAPQLASWDPHGETSKNSNGPLLFGGLGKQNLAMKINTLADRSERRPKLKFKGILEQDEASRAEKKEWGPPEVFWKTSTVIGCSFIEAKRDEEGASKEEPGNFLIRFE